jgi:hypothetical protein
VTDDVEALSVPASEVPSFVLAVVDPDPKLRTRLALQLGEEADVVTYSEVAALAEYQPPGRQLVVIFGPGLADAPGLSDIERFTRARPDAGAILVASTVAGIGVTFVFSVAIWGVARFADLSRNERPVAAAAAALTAALALLATVAIVVLGIVVMTSK